MTQEPHGRQRVVFTLGATLDPGGGLDEAEQAAEAMARTAGFADDLACHIGMALREAIINAVLHGNRQTPGKKVEVSCELTSADLVMRVTDEGEGLDPNRIPDPHAPENLLKSSGRGVLLMRSIMDVVEFVRRPSGFEVRMTRRLPGPPGSTP